jgi:hypothetical protein
MDQYKKEYKAKGGGSRRHEVKYQHQDSNQLGSKVADQVLAKLEIGLQCP